MRVKRRSGPDDGGRLPLWTIPAAYVVGSIIGALVFPRLEHTYLAAYAHGMSVSAALTFFSAVSSGTMALTGIVFAVAFVMVQFSAVAYSPRLVMMFASNPKLYHTMGIFFATFTYSLGALLWTDRGGSGVVPLFSTILVGMLLIASMLAFVGLVSSLSDMQIHQVLRNVGARGRDVIAQMYRPLTADIGEGNLSDAGRPEASAPVTQTITYLDEPRSIARFDTAELMRLAKSSGGVIEFDCAVGDTVLRGTTIAWVRGGHLALDRSAVMRAVELAGARTWEQDPKYPIRLLVDIAIRALSPAVNDPTTAVQALDQIEDLLRRLGQSDLDNGRLRDDRGCLRVIVPMPNWLDYLSLSFDEIRQFGMTSVQVLRRLRSALVGLAGSIPAGDRREATTRYLHQLDLDVDQSNLDDLDQIMAHGEDRQGLGMSRTQRAEAP